MDKQIPIYFDSVIVSSPIERISESNPNLGRLKVRVFTKYENRNGSYITDKVADQLINSAIQGNTPVVGFFDQETKSWASHSGPTLANAYGYVESFLGWEPFEDTDGITRDYAVFSIILFTNYFEEANKIFGQNQSMELDPDSIDGTWTLIDNKEYFVYTKANMLGFCIIGEHEPCFSVSAFFSKNDDTYKSQYEKFSSLLFDLKTQVEEAKKNNEGGEQPMTEFEEKEVVEEVQVDNPQVEEPAAFQAEEETVVEQEVVEPATEEQSAFEILQQQFNELQASFNELQTNYEEAQNRISEFETTQNNTNNEIENLRTQNEQLQASIQSYEAQILAFENDRKNNLIEKYEKVMSEEEISPIRSMINDFSYDELESKLAITFANNKMTGHEESKKVPIPEPQKSQFALIIEKYHKN